MVLSLSRDLRRAAIVVAGKTTPRKRSGVGLGDADGCLRGLTLLSGSSFWLVWQGPSVGVAQGVEISRPKSVGHVLSCRLLGVERGVRGALKTHTQVRLPTPCLLDNEQVCQHVCLHFLGNEQVRARALKRARYDVIEEV